MSILICRDNEDLMLKKSNAFQYKTLDFTGVSCGQAFNIEDKGDTLLAVPSNESEENPIFTVITNEFGLYSIDSGVSAKLKVSFCDNGMMVVDIIKGAILIKPEDEVLLASRDVSDLPKVDLDAIYWVNADMLLSYKECFSNLQSKYYQDFEFSLLLKGGIKNTLRNFCIRVIGDEVYDISGGHIAVIEAQLKVKEEAKQAKKNFKSIISQSTVSSYDFEEDDYYNDDSDTDVLDDIDYYSDDEDDGSAY